MMQNNPWRIMPMAACHTEQIAALEACCFSDPWSLRSIQSELENPLSIWLVALDGDCVIGYIGSQRVLEEADIMNLAVAPQRRRCGLGRALLEALLAALSDAGVCTVALEVRVSNTAALELYQTMGFAAVGRRPRYYRHPAEDALILKKQLGEDEYEHTGSGILL